MGPSWQQFWTGLLLSTPRIIGITLFIPFLRPPQIPPMARNVIVFILGLVLLPLIWQESAQFEGKTIILLILKEMLIGLLIGFVISLTFLIPQAIGDFIDNQRGASIASLFNPAFGGQASPLGLLLSQAFLVWFILSGGFIIFFELIFTSFTILPIGQFLPKEDLHLWRFATHTFTLYMKLALIIAAPVVLSMLVSEMSLGLVSRFAPQLNVFFLSMSLKSIIAIIILLFYYSNILDHIWREGLFFDTARDFIKDAAE
jgi:type III secretion protein T